MGTTSVCGQILLVANCHEANRLAISEEINSLEIFCTKNAVCKAQNCTTIGSVIQLQAFLALQSSSARQLIQSAWCFRLVSCASLLRRYINRASTFYKTPAFLASERTTKQLKRTSCLLGNSFQKSKNLFSVDRYTLVSPGFTITRSLPSSLKKYFSSEHSEQSPWTTDQQNESRNR